MRKIVLGALLIASLSLVVNCAEDAIAASTDNTSSQNGESSVALSSAKTSSLKASSTKVSSSGHSSNAISSEALSSAALSSESLSSEASSSENTSSSLSSSEASSEISSYDASSSSTINESSSSSIDESSSSSSDAGSAIELLTNGDFSAGTSNWTIPVHGDYAGSPVSSVSAADGVLNINITSGGNQTWAINASQQIPLTSGRTYILSFEAKASAARSFKYGLGQNHDPFSSALDILGSLSTDYTSFSDTLQYSDASDDNSRVFFDVGNDNNSVMIKNVSVKELTPALTKRKKRR